MGDIGAVETFATRDEEFGGDQLLGGKNLATSAEDFVFLRPIDPLLLNGESRIANPGDEVDEVVAAAGLGQPDGILDIGVSKPS